MPSRRVVADRNAGTYYLTLTIQCCYYLFDRHSHWANSVRVPVLCPEEQRAGIERSRAFLEMAALFYRWEGNRERYDGMNIRFGLRPIWM
jgi:hypothetical protein